MSEQPSDTLEQHETWPMAGEDVVVVRYKFGFPHALALMCVVVTLLAAWGGPISIATHVAPEMELGAPTVVAQPESGAEKRDRATKVVDSGAQDPLKPTALAPPQEIIEVVEIDPRVDEDFDALDPSSLKQLNRFLKRYRDNSYAKAQGYVGQATEWRRHAIWRAEDKRLRRRQRSVQWIHE